MGIAKEERGTSFLRNVAAFEWAIRLEDIWRHLAKIEGVQVSQIIHKNTSPLNIALISSGYAKAFFSPVPVNYFSNLGDHVVYATPDTVFVGIMSDSISNTVREQVERSKQRLPQIPREEVLQVFSLINSGVDPEIICRYIGGTMPLDLEERVFGLNGETKSLRKTDFLGAVAYLTRENDHIVEIARQILDAKKHINIVADLSDPNCLTFPSRPVVHFALRRAAEMGTKIRIIAGPVVIAEEPLIRPSDFYGKQFKLSDEKIVDVNAEGGIQISYKNGNGGEPINLDLVQTANYLASLVPKGLPIDLAIFASLSLAGKEPDNFFANYNLGNLLLQDGRFEESVAYLLRAQDALQQLSRPVVSFGKGTEQDRSHVEAVIHNNLGYAHMMAGENEAALTEFGHALGLDPTTPFANNNMGIVYQIMGSYTYAQSRYVEELKVNPNHPTAAASIGRVGVLQTLLK